MSRQCPSNCEFKNLFATKLNVIYQRAEAKDYLDIDALIRTGIPLTLGLAYAKAVYGSSFNIMLPLKALTFFDDGDLPMLPSELKDRLIAAARDAQNIPVIKPISNSI